MQDAGRRREEERREGQKGINKSWEREARPEYTTRHRAVAARANFLANDSGDLMYCATEFTRQMSAPNRSYWDNLIRVERCFEGRPKLLTWCRLQDERSRRTATQIHDRWVRIPRRPSYQYVVPDVGDCRFHLRGGRVVRPRARVGRDVGWRFPGVRPSYPRPTRPREAEARGHERLVGSAKYRARRAGVPESQALRERSRFLHKGANMGGNPWAP